MLVCSINKLLTRTILRPFSWAPTLKKSFAVLQFCSFAVLRFCGSAVLQFIARSACGIVEDCHKIHPLPRQRGIPQSRQPN
jgi:hypothetical protein